MHKVVGPQLFEPSSKLLHKTPCDFLGDPMVTPQISCQVTARAVLHHQAQLVAHLTQHSLPKSRG